MDDRAHLYDQAERCRRLARSISDTRTIAILRQLADAFDARARDERTDEPERATRTKH